MDFKNWLENVVYEGEGVRIRDADPSDIPAYFIHTTEDPADALSIQKSGFNLRFFNRTARRFSTPDFMTKFSPRGVYALAGGHEQYEKRPYVLFTADINKALVIETTGPEGSGKETLSKLYGGKTGTELRKALLRDGYQAVLHPGSEQIFLDPKIIKVVSVGNANQTDSPDQSL